MQTDIFLQNICLDYKMSVSKSSWLCVFPTMCNQFSMPERSAKNKHSSLLGTPQITAVKMFYKIGPSWRWRHAHWCPDVEVENFFFFIADSCRVQISSKQAWARLIFCLSLNESKRYLQFNEWIPLADKSPQAIFLVMCGPSMNELWAT